MTKCTWVDCTNEALHPCIAQDGEVWANLCDVHDRELSRALEMTVSSVPEMMSAYVKAGGGPKVMAARAMR